MKSRFSFAKVLLLLTAILTILAVASVVLLPPSSPAEHAPEESTCATQALPAQPQETLPAYITEEVSRVADIVTSRQTDHSFTFLAISDTHECADNTAANQQVGQAAALLRQTIDIDFAALLGDITSGTSLTTIEEGLQEIQAVNGYLEEAFSGIPNFRTVGNHDVLCYSFPQNQDFLDNAELFPLIGAYNTGATFGSDTGGYCYRDFEAFKTRIILLNTSDTEGKILDSDAGLYRISGNQLQWFAETLDLSAKTDARNWNILILSHIPIDHYKVQSGTGRVLDAYMTGTSTAFTWKGVEIHYDFAQKNAAAIIGNVHGHEHYFSSDYLRLFTQSGAKYRSCIPRVCVPNASFTRVNTDKPASIAAEPDRKPYVKVADCAESTTFHVITIDPVARTISCANYGAGYDRSLIYDTRTSAPAGNYTNLIPSAQVLRSSKTTPLDGTGYRNGACLAPYNIYDTKSSAVLTGAIPYRIPATGLPPAIYIWGGELSDADYVLFSLLNPYKSQHYLQVSGDDISDYFTIEKLADHYYKLTPIEAEDSSVLYQATKNAAVRYIAWSLEGYGRELVLTLDEPILN